MFLMTLTNSVDISRSLATGSHCWKTIKHFSSGTLCLGLCDITPSLLMSSSLFPPMYQAVFGAENAKLHDHEHGAQREPSIH